MEKSKVEMWLEKDFLIIKSDEDSMLSIFNAIVNCCDDGQFEVHHD